MPLKILLPADSFNDRVYINEAYVQFASQFGEVMLIAPGSDPKFWLEHGDILFLPGGADVDPRRYNEWPTAACGRSNPIMEFIDTELLAPWIETGKPIIGICRGLQTLNVALGGSLFQDIDHHSIPLEDRSKTVHDIYTEIEGYELWPVNSFHHQAIKKLGEGLQVLGWSAVYKGCPSLRKHQEHHLLYMPTYFLDKDPSTGKKDKLKRRGGHRNEKGKYIGDLYPCIAEIVKHKTKPYIAFQYHPEELNCPLATDLITQTLAEYYGAEEVTQVANLTTVK